MKTIINFYCKALIYIFCLSTLLITNILRAQENIDRKEPYFEEQLKKMRQYLEYLESKKHSSNKRFVLIVNSIILDSPAERSGIAVNDIIYSLNNKLFYDRETTSLGEEFINYLSSLPEGSHNLVVLRKGEKVNLQINLPSLSTSTRLGINIEVIENDPQIYFDRAIDTINRATKRNDLKKAANLFEKAKALSPNWPDVYHNLGLIYEKLDYYDKAAENFSEYLKYALREKLSDVESITMAIDRNKRKYELLESVKAKMVNSKWVLIKTAPFPNVKYPMPKFKFDNLGRMWVMTSSIPTIFKREVVERNIKDNPWFPVKFDGKFFEIKVFLIVRLINVTNPEKTVFSSFYIMYRGEIDLNSSIPTIIIRRFGKWGTEDYNNFDDALNKVSHEYKDYKFDEIKDFSYELHYRSK